MNLRVLVVESEPEEALFLRDVLTELDGGREWTEWTHLEALYAGSWAEARQLLACERVDVLLLDLDLSDTQGKQTFRCYQDVAPQLPAVLLVDRVTEVRLAEQLLREGAQEYLVRNEVDCAPLARALRNAVERHRLLAGLRATSMVDGLTGLLSRDAFLLLADRDCHLAGSLRRRLLLILAELVGKRADPQDRDLDLVDAAEQLRTVAGPTDLVARVGRDHLALSVLETAELRAEQIWERLHAATTARGLRLGAAVFDPERPLALDQLLEQAARDLRHSAAAS
jgi:PleD family two-component response regulator